MPPLQTIKRCEGLSSCPEEMPVTEGSVTAMGGLTSYTITPKCTEKGGLHMQTMLKK
jgi:hypothetical protein